MVLSRAHTSAKFSLGRVIPRQYWRRGVSLDSAEYNDDLLPNIPTQTEVCALVSGILVNYRRYYVLRRRRFASLQSLLSSYNFPFGTLTPLVGR